MNKQKKIIKNIIPWAKPQFSGKEQTYISDAINSTWISGGPYVDSLECVFSDYVKSPFALATSNGTTAIHMAYLALGLKPGDEVVIPGFGFLAAANLALQFRAKPIFAEVDPKTWLVTAAAIEECLSTETKIIIPIHSYGNVCEMDTICKLAQDHDIPVIEDTAEAFASTYKGHQAGSMGSIGTYSFQATKTITTGEGGMVVTKNEDLFKTMALYRSHGLLRKIHYWHELPGNNFRLTNLQAAVGCAQMEMLNQFIHERDRVHTQYKKFLPNKQGITLQHFASNVKPVLWAMAIKLDQDSYPQGRDKVIEQMQKLHIETRPGFYAPSFMEFYSCPNLPVCEEISKQVISLPTFTSLQNEQIEYICDSLIGLQC
jgi:perosamine synthetase